MSKALLIVNPSSGNEEGKVFASAAKETLESLYGTVVLKWTEKAGDARDFAAKAALERFDAVFVMGGDGTVNEGVSGLAEQPYRPDFGFIPLGTVNDLGRALGIPLDPEDAIQLLSKSVKRKIDVGKVNEHYFIDCVAIGTLPKAVHEVSPEQKTRLGALAYFIEGAKSLKDHESYTFDLNLDGEEIEQESILVVIALTNSIGSFKTLLPHARPDDGFLHLMGLKGDSILDKLNLIPKIFTGKATEDEQVLYRKFKTGKVHIREQTQLFANVDGDEGDPLPLNLQVLERHINVFVPEEGQE